MEQQKKQMEEAAVLYYAKKYTQQEIADLMNLSRQTVSKLLNDAVKENIVEIKIHNSKQDCEELGAQICRALKVRQVVVCAVSNTNADLRRLMTVRKAAECILPLLKRGNQKIAVSWGRTIQLLAEELPREATAENVVFPLFGATDQEQVCFMSNELARGFADKIGAGVKYAWFPYRPDSREDCALFKKTSYYKKLCDLWGEIDIAIVGIGNHEIIQTFSKAFGYNEKCMSAVGDISTHFFDAGGSFVELYENTLCASKEHLRQAKQTVAVACGEDKAQAIIGALRTGLVDTLITDEYTARAVLARVGKNV
ncbi:MAG: helix-turn-helix domain-containing protein [Oscillospiraceae bacterium]|nr:helix-turn-helix domain-containing protein [Oscillospiraceae bacterium]